VQDTEALALLKKPSAQLMQEDWPAEGCAAPS
jgi:hypothetical protein